MLSHKGVLHQHGGEFAILHRVADIVTIVVVLWLSATLYGVHLELHYTLAAAAAVVVFLLFAESQGLYASWRAASIRHEAVKIVSVWALSCFVVLALGFFTKSSLYFSRVAIVGWMMATPFMLTLERVLLRYTLRHFRKLGMNTRSVALVGSGSAASQLLDTIVASPWMGLRVEGVYDNDVWAKKSGVDNQTLDTLMQRIHEQAIDAVYICYPLRHEEKIRALVAQLADTAVSVHVVPDMFVSDLLRARWTTLGSIPLVSVFDSSMYGTNILLKRLEDVILGSLILLLISPLLCVIALSVKLSSPGPVLFKQRRYGLSGGVIEVWKFRSMSVLEDGAVVTQAQKNDPRVTRVGAFLRKTSLDELPQFVNVLQGQMSIVGPRPHAVAHNEEYRKLIHGYMLRHMVKPGITGWAQINGWRGETDTTEKMAMRVKYDLDYINNWTIWFDLKIIALTILRGMRGKNAY